MREDMSGKVAIVTGANRGLGLETSKELAKLGMTVIMTGRKEGEIHKVAKFLAEQKLHVIPQVVDITSDESVDKLLDFVKTKFTKPDVLVNNAGVLLDKREGATGPLHATPETLLETLQTNLVGAYRMCRAFVPLMKHHRYGRIVNVSSGMGQLSEMQGGYDAYRISKTALNAMTKVIAHEVKQANFLVNSVCPGWVKTDMGGAGATRSLAEGASGIVWAATLPDDGPSGGFFRDGKQIVW